MSQQTFGDAAELEPLLIGEAARSHHQQIGETILCQLHNMAHDMIPLNVGEDRVAFFQKVFPHVGHHSLGPFDRRTHEDFPIRLGDVAAGEFGKRRIHGGENHDVHVVRKEPPSQESRRFPRMFRIIDSQDHAAKLFHRLFHDEDRASRQ